MYSTSWVPGNSFPIRPPCMLQIYTVGTWAEDTATQGCDRSADPAAGRRGGGSRPLNDPFWRESGKSQGFGDRVPNKTWLPMNALIPIIVVTWAFLMNPSVLLCRTLTGIVYSDHSGPSANGTGELELATQTGLIRIHYQKPIREDFSKTTCREVGAVWTVQTDGNRELREDELVRAHCDGNVDAAVHGAWIGVKSYIEKAAKDGGYALGYQPDRRGPIQVEMDGRKVEISGYLNFATTGMCLEMHDRLNAGTIVIESSADCYFYPDLDFTVARVTQTLWRVVNVKAVEAKTKQLR